MPLRTCRASRECTGSNNPAHLRLQPADVRAFNLVSHRADVDLTELTSLLMGKVETLLLDSDKNDDCKLSTAELTDMFRLLGIDPLENNLCVCTSVAGLVDTYAADKVGGIAPTEVLNMVAGRTELGAKVRNEEQNVQRCTA